MKKVYEMPGLPKSAIVFLMSAAAAFGAAQAFAETLITTDQVLKPANGGVASKPHNLRSTPVPPMTSAEALRKQWLNNIVVRSSPPSAASWSVAVSPNTLHAQSPSFEQSIYTELTNPDHVEYDYAEFPAYAQPAGQQPAVTLNAGGFTAGRAYILACSLTLSPVLPTSPNPKIAVTVGDQTANWSPTAPGGGTFTYSLAFIGPESAISSSDSTATITLTAAPGQPAFPWQWNGCSVSSAT